MQKGLQGWVQIFKGGKQRDASGHEHDGDALIDKAVAAFNAQDHEPPAVIGHPTTDAPAWGWVSGLRKAASNGTAFLEAQFKEVAPEFEELVKAGRYKKRSAAFYPNGALRHVGFLGAAPPAVKGLANVAFREGDGPTFEFGESDFSIARVFRSLREWLIEKEGADTADRIVPDYTIRDIQHAADNEAATTATTDQPLFEESTMPTIEQLQQQLDAEQARRLAAETKANTFEEQAKTATLEFNEAKTNQKRQEIAAAIQAGIQAGTILPAWKAMGLQTFMEALSGVAAQEAVLEFAEGDQRHKVDPAQWFGKFMDSFSAHPLFKEMVRPEDSQQQTRTEFAEAQELGKQMAAMVNPLPPG